MEIQKLLALNLRRLRIKRGLSQEALAVDAEMDTAHVSRVERAVENPSLLVIDKLAKALGVKIIELFRTPRPGSVLPKGLKPGRKRSK